jgi:hypothetical protein
VLPENRDDLRLGEAGLPHDGFLSALRPENPRYQAARFIGAASPGTRQGIHPNAEGVLQL